MENVNVPLSELMENVKTRLRELQYRPATIYGGATGRLLHNSVGRRFPERSVPYRCNCRRRSTGAAKMESQSTETGRLSAGGFSEQRQRFAKGERKVHTRSNLLYGNNRTFLCYVQEPLQWRTDNKIQEIYCRTVFVAFGAKRGAED